jgi:sugar phosphate permease
MGKQQRSGVHPVPAAQVDGEYRRWRIQILYTLIIGYAAFYLVRQNMQVAVPLMMREFGCSRTHIGFVFSAFPVVYGIGKFVSGALCDRVNVRYYMSIGLLLAALTSLFIAIAVPMSAFFSSIFSVAICPLVIVATFYSFNGLFQSAGWPPIAKLMTNWFSPKQLGTFWGIVNASHQIGSVLILVGGAWLSQRYGWRSVFYVPAILCIFVAFFLFKNLCDTPESEGLPPVAVYEGLEVEKSPSQCAAEGSSVYPSFREIFFTHILPNRALWLVCWANFFLYVVRMGFFNWAPTFLQEARGSTALGSSCQTALYEVAGLIAGIFAGYISDRWAGGRRNAVCTVFVGLQILSLLIFWGIPNSHLAVHSDFPICHPIFDTSLLVVIGFFVYGPQALAGVVGAELGSGRAAATANGLTGLFGYMGAVFSGFGVGIITDHFGWNYAILFYIVCAAISLLFFSLNWSQTVQNKR